MDGVPKQKPSRWPTPSDAPKPVRRPKKAKKKVEGTYINVAGLDVAVNVDGSSNVGGIDLSTQATRILVSALGY